MHFYADTELATPLLSSPLLTCFTLSIVRRWVGTVALRFWTSVTSVQIHEEVDCTFGGPQVVNGGFEGASTYHPSIPKASKRRTAISVLHLEGCLLSRLCIS